MLKPGDIILADEPTGSLDPISSDMVFGLIRDLCKQYRKTVLMVTHNMDLASQADRIITIA